MGVCQSHEDVMRHVAARTVEAGRQVCGDTCGWVGGQERVPGLPITPSYLPAGCGQQSRCGGCQGDWSDGQLEPWPNQGKSLDKLKDDCNRSFGLQFATCPIQGCMVAVQGVQHHLLVELMYETSCMVRIIMARVCL